MNRIINFFRELTRKYELTVIDRYLLKQLLETFLPGVVVFTSLVFASDQFLYLVKQISNYGIPFKVAFLAILLQLPYIIVFTIPMSILLATILTFNKLNTNSEITVMRACGISLRRLAVPVLVFSFVAAVSSFMINEFIVPAANTQARNLLVWAITQKNIPNEKSNFSFREFDVNKQLKRLFYISNYQNKRLEGVTVLDLSKDEVIQVLQAKYAEAKSDKWVFFDAVNYTISPDGKIMNTAVFSESTLNTSFNLSKLREMNEAKEFNYFALMKHINKLKAKKEGLEGLLRLKINLYEKISLPATCFLISIIGIPLAITPPRARFNRGLLFSILIIFCYYLLRAISTSLGEGQILTPVLAAWLPNIIVLILGVVMFYRKEFLVR
ncbi:MAG: YjgP/YjgQ family permease [Candidatus Gastranaerophilales bacterium]|nr:YjgP/YjgQ family permease [Candidatus Gastranaerophilales bacterium]